jgi:hypothetical protein
MARRTFYVFAHCLANDAPQSLGFALRGIAHGRLVRAARDRRKLDARKSIGALRICAAHQYMTD